MDQKLRTYAKRQTESKRKFDNNKKAQQSPKRQNVAQAYAVGTGERKEYAGTLPLCNKFKFHHNGPCTTKRIMPITRQGTSNNMTPEAVRAIIDQAMQRNSTNGDRTHSSEGGPTRPIQSVRACSYSNFIKCQPLNFRGTEGVVDLSRWFEKMESVFHISGCAVENQETLKKKLTDKYCPKGKNKKFKIELWNLKVRGNDVATYTQRFQELALMCTKFLADETKKVDKYISGLPDNIHGNVMSARPKTLDEAIELAGIGYSEKRQKAKTNCKTLRVAQWSHIIFLDIVGCTMVHCGLHNGLTSFADINQLAYEEKIRVLSYTLEEKSNILEYRQKLIDQATQEKQELMTKLDNEIANQAKWNNSGKNLYKLIDSSMSLRTKRGLGLDKYIGEGELGIDDSKFSIFHTKSDELEGQPIYNRFASVDHMKAVPPSLIKNYMPPSNIPDIDESHMVYGKKATDSFEIKINDDSISHSNDSFLFDFSDRSSEPSTNDLQTCDSSIRQNAEGKGILGRRPTGKPVDPNRPKPVSAALPNPVSAGQQNPVSAGLPNPGSKINGGSKSKSWSYAKGPLGRPKLEKEKDRGIVDSGCSRRKGTIKTKDLNFENVLYVEELQHFNLISVSQICDQANRVLFTENECLVLFKDFPLPDPSMVILSIPRKHNLYTFSLNELASMGPLTCLIAKASQTESTLWNRRLGHVNFKNMNILVKGNLVRVVPIDDDATTQNDGTKSDHATTNANNLDELVELQALQRQEQAGKEEADRLGLAFPSLNP
nr:ribonuclease H-like domain-containing protein [Tanacetum cinerariifolium]